MANTKILFYLYLFVIVSCTQTKIISSFPFTKETIQIHQKIIIVGLIANTDKVLREKMENHFVGDIAEKGYTVISSFKEYGVLSFENLNENEIVNKMKNTGADVVLTVVLLNKVKEKIYAQPQKNKEMSGNRDFWSYYENTTQKITSVGYFIEETNYFWETNLFDLKTKKLLYTSQSNSFSPKSTELLAHHYSKNIVSDLTKQGILKKIDL